MGTVYTLCAASFLIATSWGVSLDVIEASKSLTWRTGTEEDLLAYANSQQMRIIDIEVLSTASMEYAAVFIDNSGDKYQEWFLYTQKKSYELIALATQDNSRLVDIDSYSGILADRLFVAVAVKDGINPWGLKLRSSRKKILKIPSGNTLLDVNPYVELGETYYTAITLDCIECVNASPAKRKPVLQVSAGTLRTIAQNPKYMMVDIERHDNGKYTAIFEKLDKPVTSYWLQGVPLEDIQEEASRRSASVYDLEPYLKKGSLVFDILLIQMTGV